MSACVVFWRSSYSQTPLSSSAKMVVVQAVSKAHAYQGRQPLLLVHILSESLRRVCRRMSSLYSSSRYPLCPHPPQPTLGGVHHELSLGNGDKLHSWEAFMKTAVLTHSRPHEWDTPICCAISRDGTPTMMSRTVLAFSIIALEYAYGSLSLFNLSAC